MTTITPGVGKTLFSLDRLASADSLAAFACPIDEYNIYLSRDALKSQEDMVAVTYLLHEQKTGAIIAYMSLIADAIKLSAAEKELHGLNYPFKTMPAMKIAKLAVSAEAKRRFLGVGSYMIILTNAIATQTYRDRFACRFLTVDADVEHDAGLIAFYKKNGFTPNVEMNNKHSKTVNMRKDLYARPCGCGGGAKNGRRNTAVSG